MLGTGVMSVFVLGFVSCRCSPSAAWDVPEQHSQLLPHPAAGQGHVLLPSLPWGDQ